MAIFKYEMRQLRSHIVWWGLGVFVFIFFALPIYMSFMTSDVIDMSAMENTDLFEMWGFDVNILTTPLGTLGFLTSFAAIAAGINGIFLGLQTFTKETVQKSAEFIYTKPYKRSNIFCAKVSSALISMVIIGVFYYIGAILSAIINIDGGFDFKVASLIALSFMMIGIFFVLFGAFVGVIYSKIRTPLLVSAGVAFMFYVLSSFANKVNIVALTYLTPYSYFNAGKIIVNGGYDLSYMATFAVLCTFFTVVGLYVFVKKDIEFIS
jgi:ABC-2 type transport system permease protein